MTVLPALGIIFVGVALPFLLKGSGRFTLPPIGKSWIVLITSLAILVTFSTGWLLTGELVTPAAVWWNDYGFPLAWRVDLMHGCPPWCDLPSSMATFNPLFFALDCSFYLAIGFALLLACKPLGKRLVNPLSRVRQFITRQ